MSLSMLKLSISDLAITHLAVRFLPLDSLLKYLIMLVAFVYIYIHVYCYHNSSCNMNTLFCIGLVSPLYTHFQPTIFFISMHWLFHRVLQWIRFYTNHVLANNFPFCALFVWNSQGDAMTRRFAHHLPLVREIHMSPVKWIHELFSQMTDLMVQTLQNCVSKVCLDYITILPMQKYLICRDICQFVTWLDR